MQLIIFIQTKFKNSMELQEARLSVLQKLWEKDTQQLFLHSATLKEGPMKIFATKLRMVDSGIRDACLRMYLDACKYKHAIAFF